MNDEKRRQRLTITLRKDLLSRLDSLIDLKTIRNRSHAIEYILSHHLGQKIKQAVILAAGEGKKIKSYGSKILSAMLPINDKLVLDHILELLQKYGVEEVIIVVGKLGDEIKERFGDGSAYDLKIFYVQEDEMLGTAGSLRAAAGLVRDTFFMFYSDLLVDINLDEFAEVHEINKALVTVALTRSTHPHRWGIVNLHGSKIVEFQEKPKKEGQMVGLINAGIFIVKKEIFSYMPSEKKSLSLERDVFPRLAQEGKLFGYPFGGQWHDLATNEDYEQAVKNWKNKDKIN